jgi:uncharacterized protein
MSKALLLSFFLSFKLFAELNIPTFNHAIYDQAGLLTQNEVQTLDEIVLQVREQTKAQMQIWVTPDLQGTSIEELSIKAVEKNRLGDKGRDDGILIVIALKDRAVRIEVGQGLEGVITDYLSHKVVKEVLSPSFKKQQFFEGLAQSLIILAKNIDPKFELKNSNYKPKSRKAPNLQAIIFLIFGIIVFILNRIGPMGGGHWRGGRGGYGGGGFSSGGSSPGGFGGFGGGGFSGGGSSGDW